VPSEYKRVVGASLLKYVTGLESTMNTQRINKQATNLIIILNALVGVCKTTHARHDTEDVVVHGIHAEVERR